MTSPTAKFAEISLPNALELREAGNQCYRNKNYRQAVICYSDALRCCEPRLIPLITHLSTDSQMLLLNRSKAYFALELFQLAFVDVSLVLAANRGVFSRPKDHAYMSRVCESVGRVESALLHLIESGNTDLHALERLAKVAERFKSASSDKPVKTVNRGDWKLTEEQSKALEQRMSAVGDRGFRFTPVLLPDPTIASPKLDQEWLQECSREIQNWPIEIKASNIGGRGMFATRPIANGKTIWIERPVAVGAAKIDQHCDNCGVETVQCTCAHCQQSYCSTKCRTDAWDKWHQAECGWQLEDMRSRALRGFTQSRTLSLLCIRIIAQWLRKPVEPLFDTFPQLRQLCIPPKSLSDDAKFRLDQTQVFYTRLLEVTHVSPNWLSFAEYQALFLALLTNVFLACTKQEQAENQLGYGCALFKVVNHCNHSCVPNAGYRLDGHQMTLRATRNIAQGEEICISYFPFFSEIDRRREAMYQYGFICQCPLCLMQKRD